MNALAEWLFERTLPVWLTRGLDFESGGFHEKLSFDLVPVVSVGKRVLVQARQCYVFAGPGRKLPGASAAAKNGYDFMLAHYRHPDRGWRHRTAIDGTPLDDSRDLYDQAFALFAMAWMIQAFGRADARALADETLGYLDAERRHSSGGYSEMTLADGSLSDGPRRQNPHMHLFEALLALHEATADSEYLERAMELFELAQAKFLVDGTLREYFTDALEPAPGEAGRIVEPGHHLEWVWLLHRYAELTEDRRAIETASQLYTFALEFGYDRTSGGVCDTVMCDGRKLSNSRRLWPQTEALKAHAARCHYTGDSGAIVRIERGIEILLRDHLGENTGGWLEHLDFQGNNFYDSYPASTLYHLAFAVAELEILRDARGN